MLIKPDWPAPAEVVAASTTRTGLPGFAGASEAAYARFNLGDHVGDRPEAVAANREALLRHFSDLKQLAWLEQVHGTQVQTLSECNPPLTEADAAITARRGLACVVMTADCLPVLFCDRQGHQVAAAHAGWRGLCEGVLVEAVRSFSSAPEDLLAWMGPAISARHFEVGSEVKAAFMSRFYCADHSVIERAFSASALGSGHCYADLYALARAQLASLGVGWIGGGEHCTFAEPEHFFSYRRDDICGRQASLIYLS